MNALIEDSHGELITISIQETDTFRELNKRIKKEYGLQMDFTNLHGYSSFDLDENILASLSNTSLSNHTESVIEETIDEECILKVQPDEANVVVYQNDIDIHATSENDEAIEMHKSYQLITLDSGIELDQQVLINSTDENVFLHADNSEITELMSLRNNKRSYSKDTMQTNAKVILEITNDVASPLCRLCANKSDEMVYIFGTTESRKEIAEKIDDCLPITVSEMDTLPKQVCHSCLEKLEMCYEFHKTVIEAEASFVKMDYGKLMQTRMMRKTCPLCRQCTAKINTDPDNIISLADNNIAEPLSSLQLKEMGIIDTTEMNEFPPKEETEYIENDITRDEHSSDWQITNEQIKNESKNSENSINEALVSMVTLEPIKIASCEEKQESNRTKNTNFYEMRLNMAENKEKSKVEKLKKNLKQSGLKTDTVTTIEKTNKVYEKQKLSTKDHTYKEINMTTEISIDNGGECNAIKCRICGETFETTKKCYMHSSIHAMNGYYPCSLCEKTFINEENYNDHSVEHTEGKKCERRSATYACDECGKKFVSEERLQFHMNFHKPEARPCYCEKCDKFMVSESSLYHHLKTVHLQYKEFCCDICGKQFRAQAQLDSHQRKHKDERPFECTICKKRFYSNEILKRHKKLHLPDKPYQCDQCGKRFDRTNTLTKHLLRHQVEAGRSMTCYVCTGCNEVFIDSLSGNLHIDNCILTNNGKNSIIEERTLTAMYRCEFCERCYTDIKYMKMHRACHTGLQPYVCTICDITYATYNQATAHKSAHKKSSKEVNVKEDVVIPKYFSCECCNKQFLHFTNMNIHRKACASGKNWTCRYCGFVFENAKELSRHKKGKDNEKTWPCEGCNMIFGSICALEIHKEIHTKAYANRKLFKCLYCGKEFVQKTQLTIHIRSHTGERPYACDLCDKAYKIKAERDNHRRTHTGERPFKCTLCDKTFTNPARLREHTRFHSGIRPYKCNLCERAFKKANARKVHMTIHTGEKPYQCDVCSTYFRRMGDMRKHKKTQHGVRETIENSSGSLKID
ncbi:zinc finger protein 184 isoform X2 [Cephus cinctus]|uniref:Zinc finger protein 865 n=1 Tax=Cephus cinctus TaxID=211228 RepID=A0AAJ7FCD2_CEPCN|nr:zinc finger protein 184 isoform X2 [Cephus cinctus]